ncbi:MAG: hypothetical protein KJ941_07140 [Bacteroidetes bacterium]|nr:hypothetical protein [Bacteroidota bacterium]
MKRMDDFAGTNLDQWKIAVEKELKGLDFNTLLIKKDPIEELEYEKFKTNSDSTKFSFHAELKESNDWEIHQTIEVKDERIANLEALNVLNLGVNALTFLIQKKEINWDLLLENIGLNYISTSFECLNETQATDLSNHWKSVCTKPIHLIFDCTSKTSYSSLSTAIVRSAKLQQTGANSTQEIAYALSEGHELLLNKHNSIHFVLGIGANYLVEIAKIKAFKHLWSLLCKQYDYRPKTIITCQTTFVNKSLKDPYTNLLRQTTEAMSAVMGGVDAIEIQPYDRHSIGADRTLSTRMAINIQHLLKEESYLHYVQDPLGGSFFQDNLTKELIEKSWELFNSMNDKGGILSNDTLELLQEKIQKIAAKRIEMLKNKEHVLIGINHFENPDVQVSNWMELPSYLGLDALILEKAI